MCITLRLVIIVIFILLVCRKKPKGGLLRQTFKIPQVFEKENSEPSENSTKTVSQLKTVQNSESTENST